MKKKSGETFITKEGWIEIFRKNNLRKNCAMYSEYERGAHILAIMNLSVPQREIGKRLLRKWINC